VPRSKNEWSSTFTPPIRLRGGRGVQLKHRDNFTFLPFTKVSVIETNRKNKIIKDLCEGIYEFKKGYQSRDNYTKDKNDEVLPHSHGVVRIVK
jgi:hypothetical protein